jgi:hypothetical protein
MAAKIQDGRHILNFSKYQSFSPVIITGQYKLTPIYHITH